MKQASWAAVVVGSWMLMGCGGVDVPTSQDQQITGVDDSSDDTAAEAPANAEPAVAGDAEGDTGEDGLADDPEANGPAVEGEGDPGEEAAVGAIFANGSTVECTANLNLRSTASTSGNVLRTMPDGSIVKVINGVAQNGFVKVEHNGLQGYAAYRYLQGAAGGTSGGTGGTPSSSKRDAAIAIAKSGVGFSYWWGGGKWQASGATASNKGKCTGSCPSCSHSGQNGADCSGYVAKVWQVPSSNTNVATASHPYSTSDFFSGTGGGQWANVSKSSIQKGDALVYRSGGAGHIVIFESGDAWGQSWTYEARACSYGIVHNVRSIGSGYKGIKRTSW